MNIQVHKSRKSSQVMRLCKLTMLIMLGAACTGPSEPDVVPDEVNTQVSIIFFNGDVYTVVEANPWAQAVAIDKHRIAAVGDNETIIALAGPDTTRIDLAGRMLLPGFHDTHAHPEPGGLNLTIYCNMAGLRAVEPLLAKIRQCAESTPEGQWVTGSGWSTASFPQANPMKEPLDAISIRHPMFLTEEGGHSAWVNSAALTLAGIDADTVTPKGGIIMRDEHGNPSGTLRESAMFLVRDLVPVPAEADRLNALRAAMTEANRFGITAMVDAMVSPAQDALYLKLASAGELTVRMNLAYHLTPDWDEDFDALLKRYRDDSEYLRGTQVKLWMDGVVEAQTAAMKAPYVGQPDNTGLLMYTDEQLNRWVTQLEASGFQLHMHTIGDAAVSQALTALEESRKRNNAPNRRPYLIHNYLVDKADYPRFLAAGATANFTMLWDQLETVMSVNTLPYLTEQQRPNIMPMGQMHDAGIIVTGGSDWPVSQISPLASMEVGVTGGAVPYHLGATVEKDQPVMIGERVGLETMIRAYTLNAAYAAQQEGVMGSISVGKFADLVVLENNLFNIPATEIAETQVDLTLVGGEIVYRRPGLAIRH